MLVNAQLGCEPTHGDVFRVRVNIPVSYAPCFGHSHVHNQEENPRGSRVSTGIEEVSSVSPLGVCS